MSSAVDYSCPLSPSAHYEAHEAANAIIDCEYLFLGFPLSFDSSPSLQDHGSRGDRGDALVVDSEEEMVLLTIMGKLLYLAYVSLLMFCMS